MAARYVPSGAQRARPVGIFRDGTKRRSCYKLARRLNGPVNVAGPPAGAQQHSSRSKMVERVRGPLAERPEPSRLGRPQQSGPSGQVICCKCHSAQSETKARRRLQQAQLRPDAPARCRRILTGRPAGSIRAKLIGGCERALACSAVAHRQLHRAARAQAAVKRGAADCSSPRLAHRPRVRRPPAPIIHSSIHPFIRSFIHSFGARLGQWCVASSRAARPPPPPPPPDDKWRLLAVAQPRPQPIGPGGGPLSLAIIFFRPPVPSSFGSTGQRRAEPL